MVSWDPAGLLLILLSQHLMVSMMEAKTSLFLKQSQLLLQIHSINDSRNAQECLDCIQAICATLSNTYGGEISGPHINVPLDPKHLMLIWDMEAFFTRLHFEVILLTHRSTVSLVLGQHYTSLQIPRDSQSIFLCFLSLPTDRCPFILSPTLPPNSWWSFWGQYWLHQDAVDNLWVSNTIYEGEILSSRCI